jgi:hypothetical protein
MSTFYIASLKHTSKHDEHITFWARFDKGYTPVIGQYAGRYCFGEAMSLNDGMDCLAVPAHVVQSLVSPEPYYRPGSPQRFYDQRGPVVDNTRANWNRLIASSLRDGRRIEKVKVTPFRGQRCSFAQVTQA